MTITNATFPQSDTRPSADGPLLPRGDAAPAPDQLLTNVVKGAHDTIDRLAGQAAPKLQRLQEGMASAGDALQDQADRLRQTGDKWTDSLRGSVRDNPLAAIATAVVVGLLIARVTR
jgi:ElaB/YqjD/DUF883 family membrane-anchored ribosome-binding protein